ncbi:MAG: putative porin [Gammaproteobacteria bacterium]|nr:putative porin [Gammaproteobacteria bacterium]MBU1555209.1 putative porin [Gammaproteobacteria bacterium]MBU2071741.1 putative porin [Gammaproteobacteria bacterium]MBU2181487.1 putative porin [Gammaproteobacteria bacterium]MBU2203533.1 putative porin [Gammaproteobacteria bacterium]
MTLKYVLPVIALAATAVSAEEYQLFTGLQADHYRVSGDNETNWNLNGTYFIDKKVTLGPLDQFEYINKVTNISASFARLFDNNAWSIGGEYFAENGLVVSASHGRVSGDYQNQLGLGYLVSDNLIVRAEAFKSEGSSTDYRFSASYNHQLQGNDYVGFTAYTDDEFDYFGISSKYFASLGEARFIAAGITIEDNDGSIDWAAAADYYFSKMTSVGLSYTKADNYSLNAKHFFTPNWAVEGSFASNTGDSALKTYSLGVIGQF